MRLPQSRTPLLVFLAICIFWVALTFMSALQKSAAGDETAHFGSGLAILHFHDYRINPEHPPLAKVLAMLPVYLFARPDMWIVRGDDYLVPWFNSEQWKYGYWLLFKADGPPPPRRLMWGRVLPILTALLGGLLALCWGRAMSKQWAGGLIAATLLLFYPEYIGHARYITLDVPNLIACATVTWCAWLWWRNPDWKRGLLFAVVGATGAQVKLPVTLFIAFEMLTLFVLCFFSAKRVKLQKWLWLAMVVAMMWVIGAWTSAGFRYKFAPPDAKINNVSEHFALLNPEDPTLIDKTLLFISHNRLLPQATLATFRHAFSFKMRPEYFMGEWGNTGWYSYFFITMLFKTPVPMLLGFLALGILTVLRIRKTPKSAARALRIQQAIILGAPFAVLFGMMVVSRVNIGHRHILFIYFPLCVFLGAEVARWLKHGTAGKIAGWALIGSHVAICLLAFPHYATYANHLIGSSYRLSKIVLDSNVDWGQDVPLLARTMEKMGIGKVNYALFGHNPPEVWGIDEYRWILPDYPFATNMPEAAPPDWSIPTAVSLHNLTRVRDLYPGRFEREPDYVLNSILLFMPQQSDRLENS